VNAVTIRTQDEIVQRTREAMERDLFGFEAHEYLSYLDFDHAREFLKADMNEAVVREAWLVSDLNALDAQAKGYLPFWLEKIEGGRGISVGRATQHFTAWKWLLGHSDADTFPGSVNGGDGGWYQRRAYDYITQQIESGEWDRLTKAAIEKADAKSAVTR
jgi:hypothetical protein